MLSHPENPPSPQYFHAQTHPKPPKKTPGKGKAERREPPLLSKTKQNKAGEAAKNNNQKPTISEEEKEPRKPGRKSHILMALLAI